MRSHLGSGRRQKFPRRFAKGGGAPKKKTSTFACGVATDALPDVIARRGDSSMTSPLGTCRRRRLWRSESEERKLWESGAKRHGSAVKGSAMARGEPEDEGLGWWGLMAVVD